MFELTHASPLSIVCAAALLFPLTASAESFTGTIVGHTCAHQGKTCPVDRLDPHIALEPDFVLLRGTDDYLFLPNVPRDVKVRHVLQEITVTGELNTRYNSVAVDKVKVQGETVWSQTAQEYEINCIYDETCQFAY